MIIRKYRADQDMTDLKSVARGDSAFGFEYRWGHDLIINKLQINYERSFSKENLETVVKESKSKAEVLRKLGLAAKGGNYKSLDR